MIKRFQYSFLAAVAVVAALSALGNIDRPAAASSRVSGMRIADGACTPGQAERVAQAGGAPTAATSFR